MKTTLTLEDVERLESLYNYAPADVLYNAICPLLPLILPVIREHVKENPEGLRPHAQASLDQGTDVPPVDTYFEVMARDVDSVIDSLTLSGPVFREFREELHALCNLKCCIAELKEHPTLTGGTSAHPGSHSDSGQSKAAASQIITGIECDHNHGKLSLSASQKTAQEGSVCEVEPLGEVIGGIVCFRDSVNDPCVLEDTNGHIEIGLEEGGVVSFQKNQVPSLIAHLRAWLLTGSFDLKGLPSSPPSSEDTELLDWLEERKLGVYTMTHPIECGPNPEFTFDGWAVGHSVDPRMSLRDAIRAARAKEAQASTTSQKGVLG